MKVFAMYVGAGTILVCIILAFATMIGNASPTVEVPLPSPTDSPDRYRAVDTAVIDICGPITDNCHGIQVAYDCRNGNVIYMSSGTRYAGLSSNPMRAEVYEEKCSDQ